MAKRAANLRLRFSFLLVRGEKEALWSKAGELPAGQHMNSRERLTLKRLQAA